MTDPHEIECCDCAGNGQLMVENPNPLMRGWHNMVCEACNGAGWRQPTDDEIDAMSENAFSDMCEGEPPITMQERHEAAWKQKQGLRR